MSIDVNSLTWQTIERLVMNQLHSDRERLEWPVDEREADLLRGRIQAFKEILELSDVAASAKGTPQRTKLSVY
jgi:hypothetical protein